MKKIKILIEGIGGIGGLLAASLIKNNHYVSLVTNNEKITNAIKSEGVKVKSPQGTVQFYTDVYTKLEELKGNKYDIIMLLMKANGVMNAARQSIEYLEKDGYMISFQNGIVEDELLEILGHDKLISGIIGFGGTMVRPGVYNKTSNGSIHIGELTGEITDRLNVLKEILDPVDEVVITDNIRGALWSKLAINATINGMGVLTGQTLGEMLKNRKNRDIFLNIYREVIDTAIANGIVPERITADPMLLYKPIDAGRFTSFKKDMIIKIVARKHKNIKSSSLQSIERGRKTEVDYINGYVIKQAEKYSINVDYNKKLVEMVHEIEEGKRKILAENTNDI